jgi:hypothetical protein
MGRRTRCISLIVLSLVVMGALASSASAAASPLSEPLPAASLSAAVPGTHAGLASLSFAPERDVPFGPNLVAIAIGDFNGDGIADLAVAKSSAATVSIRLGKGNGTFGGPHGFAVPPNVASVAVADLNHDGKLDLVTSVYYSRRDGRGTISVLLGNGNGTFRARHDYRLGPLGSYNRGPVAIGDLNGDHRLDVVAAAGLNIYVLLGRGDGTLVRGRAIPADAHDVNGDGAVIALVLADINGDGRADVIAGGQEGVNSPLGITSVLLGKGMGSFKTPVTKQKGAFLPTSLALSDLNGDGKRDLIAEYYVDLTDDVGSGPNYGAIIVSLGEGNGGFTKRAEYDFDPQKNLSAVKVADFNGDGHRDLGLAINSGIDVVLGKGDGSFQPGVEFGTEQWTGGEMAAVADFNRDGKMDMAAAPISDATEIGRSVAIFLNRSN